MSEEEKIRALRSLISERLHTSGLVERIDAALEKGEGDVVGALSREHVIDHVVRDIKNASSPPHRKEIETTVDREMTADGVRGTGKRFLQVSISRGRAFLDDLVQEETATLQIHALALGKRLASKPVTAECDPSFDETFFFCVDEAEKRPGGLLECPDKLIILLTRTNKSGTRHLLGSSEVEWREVLEKPDSVSLNVELRGTKSECGVSVGLLFLSLRLLPGLRTPVKGQLKRQLAMEQEHRTERNRLFLMYTKQWWGEFSGIRTGLDERRVKIFAEDERGDAKLVCLFLSPIQTSLIESPRIATRFVSLLPNQRTSLPGAGEQWLSPAAFLVGGTGNAVNHSLLLCSFLLGFRLPCYVAMGASSRGTPLTWVLLLGEAPTHIDPLTGQRYTPGTPMPFTHLDCLFNDRSFYANIQPSNAIPHVRFDVSDPVLWKSLSEEAVGSMRGPHSTPISLSPSTLNLEQLTLSLEHALKRLVRDERERFDLSTHWNSDLAHLLLPALSAYELERSAGVCVSNEDFENAVRHAVPSGFTFKGYPSQFIHLNPRSMFAECLKSSVCSEIIGLRGDGLEFAVKVKLYAYPENVVACWLMFACQYRCVS